MEPVNYRITLKLNDTTKPSLAMRQGDTARRIYFQLAQDGKPYAITPGCYAVLSGVKPDGTTLFNNCVIDGNTIIYDTTEQTTAVKGRVKCELTLFDEQDQMVTSPGFDIVVHGKVLPGENVASSDEAGELRKLMSDSIEFVEDCKDATVAANAAATDILSAKDRGEFNGPKGEKGDTGEPGEKGEKGDRGEKGDPGEVNINDDTTSDDSTWSSMQISAEIADCVGYYPQNKANSQKAQARENIGALGHTITKPVRISNGDQDAVILTAQTIFDQDSLMADVLTLQGDRDGQIDTDSVVLRGLHEGIQNTDAVNKGQLDKAELAIVDKLCPSFTETGAVVTCEPVEGYPLQVVSGIVPKQSGSGTASPENVRPISGHNVVKLTHCGKNLLPTVDFDSKTLQGVTATRQYDGSIIFNGTSTGWAFFKLGSVWVREGQSYTLGFVDGGGANTYQLYASGNLTCYSRQGKVTAKATSSGYTDVCFIVYEGTTVTNLVVKPQLVFGSTAIEYEPYRAGDTFTRELGQTIYGGSFHWGSGTLTNGWHLLNVKDLGTSRIILAGTGDYANIPFDQNAPAADANNRQLAICSHLPYGDTRGNNVFWLDSTGTGLRLKVDGVTTKEAYVQWIEENEPMVAYPLATTTTSQLTPQKITALAGVNTLHSDTGDTTVTGKASPATEIEKLKNAILAMGANV